MLSFHQTPIAFDQDERKQSGTVYPLSNGKPLVRDGITIEHIRRINSNVRNRPQYLIWETNMEGPNT